MVVILALTSALVIGVSDYFGGKASEGDNSMWVTVQAQTVNAALVPLAAIAFGWTSLRRGDVVLGLVGGVAAGIAYIAFFWGLARGRVAVITLATAVVTAVLPLLVDMIQGTSLSAGQWLGIIVALVAIPLIAMHSDRTAVTALPLVAEIGVSVFAGIGFAMFFVAIGHTDSDSGLWPAVAAALGGLAVAAVAMVAKRIRPRRPSPLALGSGACAAVASSAITGALQLGPLAVATVLGSLYPMVTSALSARFDGQHLSRLNIAGMILAITGAAVVAVA